MGNLFISMVLSDPVRYFSWILAVAFSVCLHEFAHAWAALKLGDDTAARSGHLSLNPLVQMGPQSLLMLFVLGIAWGAVPVNTQKLRGWDREALTAFAGPLANLLLCGVFGLLAASGLGAELGSQFFFGASAANAVLFLLNMLPVPMLDGWAVFKLFIPPMRDLDMRRVAPYSLLFIALIFFTPLFDLLWSVGFKMANGVVQFATNLI